MATEDTILSITIQSIHIFSLKGMHNHYLYVSYYLTNEFYGKWTHSIALR